MWRKGRSKLDTLLQGKKAAYENWNDLLGHKVDLLLERVQEIAGMTWELQIEE